VIRGRKGRGGGEEGDEIPLRKFFIYHLATLPQSIPKGFKVKQADNSEGIFM
jgi:hypothetical protein